eukprot:s188_g6.t2
MAPKRKSAGTAKAAAKAAQKLAELAPPLENLNFLTTEANLLEAFYRIAPSDPCRARRPVQEENTADLVPPGFSHKTKTAVVGPMEWCNGFFETSVNPLDPKWQKSAEFGPDKEMQWQSRPLHKDQWLMSNNAIRGEIKELHSAISAVVERGELCLWELNEHVAGDIRQKKELVIPFLDERIKLDYNLKQGRSQVLQALEQLQEEVTAMDPSSEVQDVLIRLEKYQHGLLQQLNKEESCELQLMRAFFSPEEAKPLVDQLIESHPSVGSFIFFAGDETWKWHTFGFPGFLLEETFSGFMKQEDISSFSWYFNFKIKCQEFDAGFVQPLEAVLNGTPLRTCYFC